MALCGIIKHHDKNEKPCVLGFWHFLTSESIAGLSASNSGEVMLPASLLVPIRMHLSPPYTLLPVQPSTSLTSSEEAMLPLHILSLPPVPSHWLNDS